MTRARRDERGPLQRAVDAEKLAKQQSILDVITPEQAAKGEYAPVTGVGRRYFHSTTLDKWFREGGVGFDHGAQLAVEWCQRRWEARGYIGKLSANYSPTVGAGESDVTRDVELRDELAVVQSWFPDAYWNVFENVCRHGLPAGVAGSDMAKNPAQAIASAKAIVGMVASFIAAKRGY